MISIIFYYLAIGTLLPWNFFINSNGYWMYKFRTVSNNSTEIISGQLNTLQLEFMSDLANAAMIPNVTFLVLNGIVGHKFRMDKRLLISLAFIILFFGGTLSLVKINTDSWQIEFLAVTLTIIVLININSAIFQGGLFGLAGAFPSKYMNNVLSGQGIGGVLVATINIILLAIGGDQVEAAFYCFLFSVIFLIGSVFALIYLKRTELYSQCIENKQVSEDNTEKDESSHLLGKPDNASEEIQDVNVCSVLKTIRVEALTVFIIYVVTLGLFPAVTVLVVSTNSDSDQAGEWEKIYFVPVCCFLLYNIGDYIGRLLVGLSRFPKISSKIALLFSCLRIVFLPLMMMCNLAPSVRHYIPVLLPSDTAYCVLILILAITNGYLTSIVMVNAPKKVREHEQQTSSNLMVGLLGLGLISGALLSAALINFL